MHRHHGYQLYSSTPVCSARELGNAAWCFTALMNHLGIKGSVYLRYCCNRNIITCGLVNYNVYESEESSGNV